MGEAWTIRIFQGQEQSKKDEGRTSQEKLQIKISITVPLWLKITVKVTVTFKVKVKIMVTQEKAQVQ